MDSLEWGRSNRRNRIKNLTHEERVAEDVYYRMGFRDGGSGRGPSVTLEDYMTGFNRGRAEFLEEKQEVERIWTNCPREEAEKLGVDDEVLRSYLRPDLYPVE